MKTTERTANVSTAPRSLLEGVERLVVMVCADCGKPAPQSGGHIHKGFSPVRQVEVIAVSDLPKIEQAVEERVREALLDELCEWLGSDEEYEALGAIQVELEANPQLVPKTDVPLRLLEALRAAVDRFAHSKAGSRE